jgi:hypothetical protein
MPPKPGNSEGNPIPLADEHFRDTRNSIVNSGKTWRFMRLKFRLLLDAGIPFKLPPMPTKPKYRGQRLSALLMAPLESSLIEWNLSIQRIISSSVQENP